MTTAVVGSAQISVTLAIQDLQRSIASAQALLAGMPTSVPISINTAGAIAGFDLIANYAERTFGTVASLAQESFQKFLGFEGQVKTFSAVSGATAEEMNALTTEAKRIGVATSQTATSAASAAVELSKLGFSAKETTQELGGVVELAEASGAGITTAAKVIGATNSVFQRSAEDIANIVAATSNATAADAGDFLQAISSAGAVAKSNNQSLETLAITFGLLRSSGFEAASGATAVKTAINRLATPGEGAKEALAEIGVEVRDGVTKEMRDLITLVPEFRASLANFAPDKRSDLVKTIFGDEGGPAFLALLETSQEKIDSTSQTIRNSAGAASETSAKLLTGVSGTLELLGGSVDTVQLMIGENIAPLVNVLATGALSAANNFLSLNPVLQKAIILSGALAGVYAGVILATSILSALKVKETTVEIARQAAALNSLIVTKAQTAAITLATIVENKHLFSILAVAGATKAQAIAITATTVAHNIYAIATGKATGATATLATSIKTLGITFAAAAGAAYIISELFRKSEGAKFADQIRKNTEELGKFNAQTKTVKASEGLFSDLKQGANEFFDAVKDKGLFVALQQQILNVADAWTGAKVAVSDYGGAWFATYEQIGKQKAMLALEEQLNTLGGSLETSKALLTKFGLSTYEAADATRLGATGISEFKKQAEAQVEVLDREIEALKSQKGLTEGQQAVLNAEIATRESLKRSITGRAEALEKDFTATQKSTGAAQELAVSLEDLKKIYAQEMQVSNNDTSGQILATKELLSQQEISVEESQQRIAKIEQEGIKSRLDINKSASAKLAELLDETTDPEKKKAIVEEQNRLEKEGLAMRTQLADAEVANRKATEDSKLKIISESAQKARIAIEQSEQSRVTAVKAATLEAIKGGKDREVAEREAASAISAIANSTLKQNEDALRTELASLESANQKKEIGEEAYSKRKTELIQELAQVSEQRIDEEIQEQERLRTETLRIIAETVEKSKLLIKDKEAAAIRASKAETLEAIRSGQDRDDIERDSVRRASEIQFQALDGQEQVIQQELALLESANQSKTIGDEAYAKQKADLLRSLAQVNDQRIDEEIAAEDRLSEESLRQIDLKIQAVRNAADIANSAAEAEIAAANRVSEAISRQVELLQARAQLQGAKDDFAQFQTSNQISDASTAVDLGTQLQDKGLDKSVRAELEKQLKAVGGSKDVIDSIQQRQALEKQLATQQFEAIERQKQSELELAQLGIQQQKRNAEINLQEAELTQIKQQQVVEQAQLNLLKAQESNDSEAIADATAQLQISQKNLDLSSAEVGKAREGISLLEETSKIEMDLIAISQERASTEFQQQEAARQRNAAIEIASAKAAEQARKLEEATQRQINLLDLQGGKLQGHIQVRQQELSLLDEQLERLNQQASLDKTRGEVAISRTETQLDLLKEAEALQKTIDDPNADPAVAQAARSQLSGIGSELGGGVGGNSIALVEQRQQLEDQLATQKLEALQKEQELERQNLDIKNQQAQLNADILAQEAQMAVLTAQRNQLQSQANLQKATRTGDAEAIALAQQDVELATLGVGLAQQQSDQAARRRDLQAESNALLNEQTLLEQTSNTEKAQAQDNARNRAQELELATARSADNAARFASATKEGAQASKEAARAMSDVAASAAKANSQQYGFESDASLRDREFALAQKLADATGNEGLKAQLEAEKQKQEMADIQKEFAEIKAARKSSTDQARASLEGNLAMFDSLNRNGGVTKDASGNAVSRDDFRRMQLDNLKGAGVDLDKTGGGGNISQLIAQAQVSNANLQKTLGESNKGIEKRLDQLNSHLGKVASRPNSITIQGSTNPSGDLSKTLSSLSRVERSL